MSLTYEEKYELANMEIRRLTGLMLYLSEKVQELNLEDDILEKLIDKSGLEEIQHYFYKVGELVVLDSLQEK